MLKRIFGEAAIKIKTKIDKIAENKSNKNQ